MRVIEQITGNIDTEPIRGRTLIPITLNHEDLEKRHRKLLTEDGAELAISLKEGPQLRDKDILYQDSRKIIYVELKKEKVLCIMPKDTMDWAKAAYNIGNMHQKAYLKETGIYTPYDIHIEHIMAKLRIPFNIQITKLDGERANAQSTGHTHG